MKSTSSLPLCALVLALAATDAPAQGQFNLDETVALCASCHGEDGLPTLPEAPIIWGQEFYYLYVQMRDYQAGRRANEIMSEIVAGFDKDQMKALAQHFADKAWPRHGAKVDGAAAATGPAALTAGQCSQCHSTYAGDSRVPRLAGQTPEYLERTMQDFKDRVRLNAPDKSSLIASFSDDEITAMAHYLAGL